MTAGFLVAMMRLYQWLLSPLLGGQCRFEPSCSHYGIEALHRHGARKGLWLLAKRMGRCHPWCRGGWDPVPPSCPSRCLTR